nr:BTAD domain-containing putative transcriptional regulator [Geodermatophilus sabuli]
MEVRGDDGTPVAIPGAKERLLLGVLAAGAPALVPADRIAEDLWDGDPPATARKSLQAHVVRLRSALEPDRPRGSTGRHVLRRGPGYALAVDRQDLDALAFGDLTARGRAALTAGDAAGAGELLTAALDLWRGEPYADWPDAAFAGAERRRLAEVRDGARTALAEARLARGEAAALVPDLERLVAEQPLREEWWRLLVLALYRSGRQADALGAARRARSVLAEELGADPGPALRAVEAAVLAQDPDLDATPAPATAPATAAAQPAPGACPYLGLRAYEAEDAGLFAGRERVVATLVARLVDAPLVAVSGPSGAGKSSVVRAGLVPALGAGALPGSDGWRPVVLLPGRHPVDGLAGLTGEDPPPAPVLLVCDQFEELWAPGMVPAERSAFLDTVVALLDDGVVARCVVVVRGDAVGRLAEHPGFVDRLRAALVLVPPMSDPELRDVVRAPAAAVGLRVEDDLVDAVVADGLGRPAALPLLSTALVGTWERRRGHLLTLAGYLAAGGVAGALARSAEAAYAALDEPGRVLARQLFVRLADLDDGGGLVRRPVPIAELEDGGRRAVAEVFLTRRLLSVDADRLEVTHEALLRAWPRLTRWLEDDAAGRAVRRHLTPAARDWDHAGRPDDELYRGARLTAALDWATAAGEELTATERDFLAASRAQAERDLAVARDQAVREARGRRRTRRLATVLAVVLVAALVAAGLAVYFQQDADTRATEAERASRVADANWLTSRTGTASSLDTAVLLAATSVRLADTPETQDGLLALLAENQRVVRAVPIPGRVQGGRVDGTGTLWLGVGDRVVAWPTGGRGLPRVAVPLDATWGAWYGADPSPVTDTLATSGLAANDEPYVRLVTPNGEVTRLLEGTEVGGLPVAVSHTAGAETVEFIVVTPPPGDAEGPARWRLRTIDADGGPASDTAAAGMAPAALGSFETDLDARAQLLVLWAHEGGPAVLVDLAGGAQVALPVDSRDAGSIGFQVTGDGAAQFWDDGVVTRYDRGGRVLQQLDAHSAPVRRVAVSPAGWAATVGDDGVVVRWAVDPLTRQWSEPEPLTGHRGDVRVAEVDPTGSMLVTAGEDDTAIVWHMREGGGFGADYPALDGRWVSNRPRVMGPEGTVVVPTRPLTRVAGADPLGPPDDTRQVAATFLDPDSGAVVRQVVLGETLPLVLFGSSVAVRPDGGAVAVTWGLGASVLDAQGRRMAPDIVLPPVEGALWNGAPLPAAVFWSAGWTRDGSRLLLGAEGDPDTGEGARLVVVDPATGEVEDQLDIGVSAQAIAPSPDGDLLAIASATTQRIVLLDADSLQVVATVDLLDGDRPFDVAWSPDGRLLAVVGDAGLLHLVDIGTGRAREPVAISPQILLQAEWLADGRTVATVGMDGTVTLFDVERGLPRTGPLRASGAGTAVYTHLLPGPGDELVAFSGEVPGRRYPLDPQEWLAAACALAGRDLTRAEWERYLPAREWRPTCTDLD